MALEPDVPPISGVAYRLFARVVKRYFRRQFRSVMAQRLELLELPASVPLILFGNHSSWWDPMVCVLVARAMMPERRHYAPMEADALRRYPILSKIGMFPVETATTRGVAQFLRTAEAIVRDGGVLWITPQGRFADTREFPLRFKPGLSVLAMRIPGLMLLPFASEYTFWDERLPEALVRIGEPQTLTPGMTQDAVTKQLESALAAAMLELQKASCQRDASLFHVLLTGKRGTGGVYGWVQKVRGWLRGKPQVDHTVRP